MARRRSLTHLPPPKDEICRQRCKRKKITSQRLTVKARNSAAPERSNTENLMFNKWKVDAELYAIVLYTPKCQTNHSSRPASLIALLMGESRY